MARAGIAILVVLGVAAQALTPAEARQSAGDDLKKEVEELKEKVKALEVAGEPAEAAEQEKAESPLVQLLKETRLYGFVDVGFIWNTTRPGNGQNGNTGDSSIATGGNTPALDGTSVRAFDRKSRSFYLHNAQLALERTATDKLIAGYKLELSVGSDANVFGTSDSDLNDFFDVQEAHVQLLLPFEKGVDVRVGKFATLAGFEVIESKSNWNYSRSLPFLFAIPFTHTGVRASYPVHEMVNVTAGFNNGWDVTVDNNDAKTFEGQVNVNPLAWLKLYGTLYWGAEKSRGGPLPSHEPGDDRYVLDLVGLAENIPGLDNWSFGINLDFGSEEDSGNPQPTSEDADWFGFAAYARYQLNEWFTPSARFSLIDDDEGFRTGTAVAPGATDQSIREITLTAEFKVAPNAIARLELRHDRSSEDIFLDHDEEKDSQTTFGAEVIYSF